MSASLNNRAQTKTDLMEMSDLSLKNIEQQLGDLKNVSQNALIIGGAILAGYAIFDFLMPQDISRERTFLPRQRLVEVDAAENYHQANEGESFVWASIKGIGTALLLATLKERLTGLIDELDNNNAETNTNS